jgi:putative sugar O-methyltransferase
MKVNYKTYADFCKRAVDDDSVFKTFKSHPDFTYMLEHVTNEQGWDYLLQIERQFPFLVTMIDKFKTNDDIGSPRTFHCKEIETQISPTTLRYIKVLADILDNFGRYDGLDIIEIGVGYGGQCKILHDYGTPRSYTMVDLPEVLALAKKCNEYHKIPNVSYKTADVLNTTSCDLLISNYAFTEISREYQEIYVEKLFKYARMGYITCNYFGMMNKDESMSKDDVFAIKENYELIPERPLTGPDNVIYIWK